MFEAAKIIVNFQRICINHSTKIEAAANINTDSSSGGREEIKTRKIDVSHIACTALSVKGGILEALKVLERRYTALASVAD